MSSTNNQNSLKSVKSIIAKSDDGTVQITFTIPYHLIEEKQKEEAFELGKSIDVPGFRKGRAPLQRLLDIIPEKKLLKQTLSNILPKIYSDSVKKNNIKPIIYPRFEVLENSKDKDWQIRATTTEFPEFDLGDYKKTISGINKTKLIWTPSSTQSQEDLNKSNKSKSRLEKEQEIIKALLDTIKIKIPKILIEEEVQSKLARLLEQIEKLGLTLDSYLSSIKKTVEQIKAEYENQAKDAIALDLILAKIAQTEGFKIDEKEIDEAIKVSSADTKLAEELNTPEKRRLIESVLLKRKAINFLVSLS